MMSLVNFTDRLGMPSLWGWDPSRMPYQISTPFNVTFPVNVKHEQDHVYITADMPGVDPKDLDVTFEGGSLSVVGQRDDQSYRFSIYLGDEYDADTIEAELDKGVLTIKAETRPEAKPRKIMLNGGPSKSLESGEPK
jgi:HSP20 family molecular chaperone IbpA